MPDLMRDDVQFVSIISFVWLSKKYIQFVMIFLVSLRRIAFSIPVLSFQHWYLWCSQMVLISFCIRNIYIKKGYDSLWFPTCFFPEYWITFCMHACVNASKKHNLSNNISDVAVG
jgi:hypothetical protein